MNASTTRNTIPAASRTGRCAPALPNDPGLDEILADPGLSSTAKALVTVMVKNWAWSKDHCWPCDRTLAARVGKSVGHVQRCLRELEQAGRIEREKTDEVPNGRRIWLLWRRPGNPNGAHRERAPARGVPTAPARSKPIVIVKGRMESEDIQPTSPRLRSGATVPVPATVSTLAPALEPMPGKMPGPIALEADQERPRVVEATSLIPSPLAPPRGIEPAFRSSGAGGASRSVNESSELEGISASSIGPASPSAPPPASPSAPPALDPKVLVGLTPQEQVRLQELPEVARDRVLVWVASGDSILLKEARKLLAPPRPPEPPAWSLPTPELLASLPGRPDRIAPVAGRLAEDLGDPRSYGYYQSLACAVSSREQPAEALIRAWQQGMSPKAERRGAVFATVWKRETRSSN